MIDIGGAAGGRVGRQMVDLGKLRERHHPGRADREREDHRRIGRARRGRARGRTDDHTVDGVQIDVLASRLQAAEAARGRKRKDAGRGPRAIGTIGRDCSEQVADVDSGGRGIAVRTDGRVVLRHQGQAGVRQRVDVHRRRIVVDVDHDRSRSGIAVLVGDGVADREQLVVLVAAGRMVDRRILDDGVGTRRRIDRDGQDRDSTLLDEDRPVWTVDIAEPGRIAAEQQVPGQIAVAARSSEKSVCKAVGAVVADSADNSICSDHVVIVDQHVGVGTRLGLAIDRLRHFLELGRGVAELGRRNQVAKRHARIERSDRKAEIATARLRNARGRPDLALDQKRGKVGRRNFDVVDHQLRNEDRAVDDHHLGAVGKHDHEVAPDHPNVRQVDARRKDHDPVGAGNDPLRIGRNHRLGLPDFDRQSRLIARAVRISERVGEHVADVLGRVGLGRVAVISVGPE